ncbi:Hsp70 family protein [Paenibacillus sp. GCM10027627]|uniref:Hsp70 family protein n=1 Tax=unclassified Paenibacillus TaxID=185978 RepID=UPI0036451E1C
MAIIGIDLGTTNSLVSYWNGKESVIIPNALGQALTPSVVAIDTTGEMVVGQIALERQMLSPEISVSVFKRFMGTGRKVELGSQHFLPEELSALIIRSLKEDAEHHLGKPIHEAVISVPAYFNDVQRKATKRAGELGRDEESLEYYDAVIALNPDQGVFYNNKSYTLIQLGQFEEALSLAEQAIAYAPLFPNGYKQKANALFGLSRFEECLEACEEALRLNQDYVEVHLIKMKAFTKSGQFEETLEWFDTAIQSDSKEKKYFSLICSAKGEALFSLERFEEAVHICEQALEWDSNTYDAIWCKAVSHFGLEQYFEANNELDKLIENYPSAPVYKYAVYSYYNNSMPDEAMKLALEGLSHEFGEEDVLYDVLGHIFRDRGELSEAAQYYRKAMEVDSSYVSYYLNLVGVLDSKKEQEESLRLLDEIIVLDPMAKEAYERKLPLLFDKRDWKQCVQVCEELMEIDDDNEEAYLYLAKSYSKLGDKAQAKAVLEKGLKIYPSNTHLLEVKASWLFKRGYFDEALTIYNHILELNQSIVAEIEREKLMKKQRKFWIFKWWKK